MSEIWTPEDDLRMRGLILAITSGLLTFVSIGKPDSLYKILGAPQNEREMRMLGLGRRVKVSTASLVISSLPHVWCFGRAFISARDHLNYQTGANSPNYLFLTSNYDPHALTGSEEFSIEPTYDHLLTQLQAQNQMNDSGGISLALNLQYEPQHSGPTPSPGGGERMAA